MKSYTARIGVDFHVFDGKFQGSRSHLIGIFGEVTRLCPEIQFFFFLENTDDLSKISGFSEANVELIYMPHTNPIVRLLWQLPKLRKSFKLDLIHTQYIIPFGFTKGNAVTIHDVLFEKYPQFFSRLFVLRSRLLMRWSARYADLLFTVSDYSRHEISSLYGIDKEKITVLHNAVDRIQFFPKELNNDEEIIRKRDLQFGEYILTVGRIEPRKNHATLLKAYRALSGFPPTLVIVGQRDFGYGDFDAELKLMPHERKVIILSDVSDAELPVLYRHCQFFVYPSLAEGFGMPPLEAMVSGVPVISSKTTAMSEVVTDAGLLIDPNDVIALKLAMKKLLGDADLRVKLSQRGLEVAALFTWKKTAEILAHSYKDFVCARSTNV